MNFSFGTPSNTSAATTTTSNTPGFSFSATPASAATQAAPTLSLQPATTTATSAPNASAPAATLGSVTSTVQSTTGTGQAASSQHNFFQLEEFINKWTLELNEQEKLFMNQATQVNAWDKVLLANGDKIVSLNESVEKVKAEQDALEQELEFITAQHAELEECIVPLEQELAKIPQVDIERGQTYMMAETLDSQLKQMLEDVKEVVEHLNEANKFADPNDHITKIGKILNAHMSSLQWIDKSTEEINNRLEEISKMHDTIRKDNERSIRLTYYES
ncbi:nuclear pore glycoprotein p62 [Culicoides brevitarsis]|uniref:nuclear pore glycoprotein p62 n=1 Tax=Culicoides brevitarsis TaxID=469753 RepID=UPI00307B31EA